MPVSTFQSFLLGSVMNLFTESKIAAHSGEHTKNVAPPLSVFFWMVLDTTSIVSTRVWYQSLCVP